MRRLILVAVLPFALAACDGGGDPVAQAARDVAANNHARTVNDGAVSAPVDHAAMGHGTGGATDADKLYAEGEAEMHRLMAAASGKTADEAYVNKMIAHHEGAVAMAKTALEHASDPQIRKWAQGVIDAQEREIAEMKAWKPVAADPKTNH